jgi:hypothetical protein
VARRSQRKTHLDRRLRLFAADHGGLEHRLVVGRPLADGQLSDLDRLVVDPVELARDLVTTVGEQRDLALRRQRDGRE